MDLVRGGEDGIGGEEYVEEGEVVGVCVRGGEIVKISVTTLEMKEKNRWHVIMEESVNRCRDWKEDLWGISGGMKLVWEVFFIEKNISRMFMCSKIKDFVTLLREKIA